MLVLAHAGHILVDGVLFGGPFVLIAAFFAVVHFKGGLGSFGVEGGDELEGEDGRPDVEDEPPVRRAAGFSAPVPGPPTPSRG